MHKSYLSYKELKKRFAAKLIIFLILLSIIFSVFLIRLAISGKDTEVINSPPKNEDAYSVAKEFIKPGIKASSANFPEANYQCAQKPDSIYIIKSYVEVKNPAGEKNVLDYEITIQFIGGDVRNKKSWKLINLVKD